MVSIATIHLAVLALFTLATTMLVIVTGSNALRLRNVEMSWKAGKVLGFPLFSTVFLLFTVALTGWVYLQQWQYYLVPLMCYNWIGLSWFISSFLMSRRYVTDYGIVKNINDPSQTVAWNTVVDYVEKNEGENKIFVFFYPEHKVTGMINHRLELLVPVEKQQEFGRIVRNKLGRRFSLGELATTGIEQLK